MNPDMQNFDHTNTDKRDKKFAATLRMATEADVPEIAHIARVARKHNLPYLPNLHTPEEDLGYFKEKVFAEDQIVVADAEGKVVGFCAFKEDWIDHLYILPEYQSQGIGKTLLNEVKEAFPKLQLWVFQRNTDARVFYEKNGFTLDKTTDGSINEEKEPDALYIWSKENK